MYVLVNDIFDDLFNENKRLLNELLFANKCIEVLNEIKTFLDLNSNEIKGLGCCSMGEGKGILYSTWKKLENMFLTKIKI